MVLARLLAQDYLQGQDLILHRKSKRTLSSMPPCTKGWQRPHLVEEVKALGVVAPAYTESTAKKPLAGSMKKQRRPCTTQVLTQTWVPPQSNSASSCVAPSRGDCRKKSYLHASHMCS